jgi:hypothetical protein
MVTLECSSALKKKKKKSAKWCDGTGSWKGRGAKNAEKQQIAMASTNRDRLWSGGGDFNLPVERLHECYSTDWQGRTVH